MRRKNYNQRRQSVKRERAIMVLSSIFVLTALTLTGIYVKGNQSREQFDGYTVDFSSLENSVHEKYENIAKNQDEDLELFDGLESVDSDKIEIPGLMEEMEKKPEIIGDVELAEMAEVVIEKPVVVPDLFEENLELEEEMPTDIQAEVSVETHPVLEYKETEGLSWPIKGEVLIDYSMDKTVYFPTLDQYRYHDAVLISAVEGQEVCAAASGQILEVFSDHEIGNGVKMDLGNGYVLTYGQLENIGVSVGSYVNASDHFASVAKPTKYYSLEGCNLYLKLEKDGETMNPLSLLQDY